MPNPMDIRYPNVRHPMDNITGWWFGTFFIFHNVWDNPSHWLIFFKMVETTNQVILTVLDFISILLFKYQLQSDLSDLDHPLLRSSTRGAPKKCWGYTGKFLRWFHGVLILWNLRLTICWVAIIKLRNYTGWWFGTFGLFSHILGIIIPTDFHIFQRGWSHQPEYIYQKSNSSSTIVTHRKDAQKCAGKDGIDDIEHIFPRIFLIFGHLFDIRFVMSCLPNHGALAMSLPGWDDWNHLEGKQHPCAWLTFPFQAGWPMFPMEKYTTMWGSRSIAKLMQISPITMVYGT